MRAIVFVAALLGCALAGALFGAVLLLALVAGAPAQEHHLFHAFYQSWINQNDQGCCNDRDCKPVVDRINKETVEVLIEGQWCPVQPWHYLKRGNSPDASTAHACVLPLTEGRAVSPCDRLLCYQPPPLT